MTKERTEFGSERIEVIVLPHRRVGSGCAEPRGRYRAPTLHVQSGAAARLPKHGGAALTTVQAVIYDDGAYTLSSVRTSRPCARRGPLWSVRFLRRGRCGRRANRRENGIADILADQARHGALHWLGRAHISGSVADMRRERGAFVDLVLAFHIVVALCVGGLIYDGVRRGGSQILDIVWMRLLRRCLSAS